MLVLNHRNRPDYKLWSEWYPHAVEAMGYEPVELMIEWWLDRFTSGSRDALIWSA